MGTFSAGRLLLKDNILMTYGRWPWLEN
jgi:hypothetical protein